jgi:phosphoserine phosphatase
MGERPRFDAVCFDCDSTLSCIEGIDELARRAGREAEIASLTEAAMNGAIPLEEIYAKRLDIVRPDKAALVWLAARYLEEMVSGAAETVATLRRHGKAVYVVTSGLLQAVAEFARSLGFVLNEIHAVKVHLDAGGTYQGFETSSPLCHSDGKAVICRGIAGTGTSPWLETASPIWLPARAEPMSSVMAGSRVERQCCKRQTVISLRPRSPLRSLSY